MPRRKLRSRTTSNVTLREIEALRRAIHEGYPWLLHTKDNVYRRTGLNIRLNILLSYVTGISAGPCVYLGGEDHPTKETVAAIKTELTDDIAEAEERFKGVFTGKRRPDSFFRHTNPQSSTRSEY